MSVNIQQNKEIDIKDYIEDWLKQVEGNEINLNKTKKQNTNETKLTDESETKDESESETKDESESEISKTNKPGKLDAIAKRFERLKFDEKWNNKLLTDNFVLLGATGKGWDRYLTLEMALFNAGYKLKQGCLKAKIRKYIKDLTEWEFLQLLDKYKLQRSSGNFTGKWNPFGVRNKNEFLREFKSPHFTLEDDPIMFSLISQIFNVDFLIFHQNYSVQDLRNSNNKFIILYKFTETKLIGGVDDTKTFICCVGLKTNKKDLNKKKLICKFGCKFSYKFDSEHLPEEISVLLNRDEFIYKHISNLIESKLKGDNSSLHLDKIIDELEKTVCSKFTHSEIRGIVKIINTILVNNEFFN